MFWIWIHASGAGNSRTMQSSSLLTLRMLARTSRRDESRLWQPSADLGYETCSLWTSIVFSTNSTSVKEQLEMVDAVLSQAQKAFPRRALGGFTKYFASLGKAINYWRENLGDFVDLWEKFHRTKAPEGVNYRPCPLRLVSGRWGSVHAL